MLDLLRHIGRFTKRLPSYINLAWKQENWDYEYMYDMLEFKMKELYQGLCEDKWHLKSEIERRKLQIKVCLRRLERYRNWDNYVDFPTGDLASGKVSVANKEKREKALDFKLRNYNKFWSDLIKWHIDWWTQKPQANQFLASYPLIINDDNSWF